jgi:putative ABC transport system permease protein
MDGTTYRVEGEPPPLSGEMQVATQQVITPDYLETLGVRRLRGRSFGVGDHGQSAPVVLINETLARRHWPDQDPVGRRLGVGKKDMAEGRWATIVGVVEDVRLNGLTTEVEPTLYRPFAQNPRQAMVVLVKSDQPRTSLAAALRQAVWSVDPYLPLEPAALDERVSLEVARPRLNALLLTLLAGIALFLGAVGVYGVMTYLVAQRRQEIAIRVALGARLGQITAMILRFGLALALAGTGLGLLGALAGSRVISSLLYETSATDPWTLAAVCALLTLVTLGAAYLPARRAARSEPTTVLRAA